MTKEKKQQAFRLLMTDLGNAVVRERETRGMSLDRIESELDAENGGVLVKAVFDGGVLNEQRVIAFRLGEEWFV